MRRALLVLGMHRSGTSVLAGLMVRLGVASPRTLMPPNEFNPLGYWESQPIVEFHDRILRAMGSSWSAWTPVDASKIAPFADELKAIISAEFDLAPLFVVKDPRMCRIVPFWLATLETSGITPAAILIVRDPVEVAQSLAKRDHLAPESSLLMWFRHMLDAEYATRTVPRAIVTYDALLTDWRQEVSRIATTLRISWPRDPDIANEEVRQFLQPDLRHHVSGIGDLDLPPPLDRWRIQARDAFEELSRGAEGRAQNAFVALDGIRWQLNRAGERPA